MVPSSGAEQGTSRAARPDTRCLGEALQRKRPLNGCGTQNAVLVSVHAVSGTRPGAEGARPPWGQGGAGRGAGADGASRGAASLQPGAEQAGGRTGRGPRRAPADPPGLRAGQTGTAFRAPGADGNELRGQNWNPEPRVAVTRQPASRREVRTRSPPRRPAHAQPSSARLALEEVQRPNGRVAPAPGRRSGSRRCRVAVLGGCSCWPRSFRTGSSLGYD